jgi:hypothetical protein
MSDLALVMLNTGPPSDFQAKVLGVDTPLFLHNTQFYFSLLHSYVVSLIKVLCNKLSVVAHLVACLSVMQMTQVLQSYCRATADNLPDLL